MARLLHQPGPHGILLDIEPDALPLCSISNQMVIAFLSPERVSSTRQHLVRPLRGKPFKGFSELGERGCWGSQAREHDLGSQRRHLAEPSQLGRSDPGMRFVFNKGTAKVSTTF